MSPEKEKNNSNEKKNISPLNNSFPQEMNNPIQKFRDLPISEKLNLFGLLVNTGMLVAFIIISYTQIRKTNEALDRADTSNTITRESLEFAKQTTLSSDSSTKAALKIADSTMKITKENLRIIEENGQIELRGYLSVDSIYFRKFKVGEKISLGLRIINVGKTPINNFRFEGKIVLGDNSFSTEIFAPTRVVGDRSKADFLIFIDYALTSSDSIKIFNGTKKIYHFSKFIFKDVFNRIDSLESRVIYIPELNKWATWDSEDFNNYK